MFDMQGPAPPPSLPDRFRLTPEFRLLVACSWLAPAPLEPLQAEKIRSLCEEEIDWDAFLALVDRHRVPALAYAALGRHAGETLPDTITERLKKKSDECRREALQLAGETVRLAKKFAGEGIALLPLKGQILSLELYNDLGMRQSRDIDLMVKPADLDRAGRLLTAEGYRCIFPGADLTERQRKSFLSVQHHATYLHGGSGAVVELHCRHLLWTPEQVDLLWSRSRLREWRKAPYYRLDDEALLLYLCDHGASHAWFRLKWLGDVAVLLGREAGPDWDNLVETAARLDLERVLAQSALLAHWLYGIPLSPALTALVCREKMSLPLAHEAIEAMLVSDADLGRRFEGITIARYLLRLRASRQYGRILKPLLINETDIMTFTLPSWLFWLYVPLRPLFWLRRHFISKKLSNQ